MGFVPEPHPINILFVRTGRPRTENARAPRARSGQHDTVWGELEDAIGQGMIGVFKILGDSL